MIFDSHAHLDLSDFDSDRTELFERMWAANIVYVLNPGVDIESSRAATVLAEKYSQLFAAVGFHPQETYKMDDGSIAKLEKLTEHRPGIIRHVQNSLCLDHGFTNLISLLHDTHLSGNPLKHQPYQPAFSLRKRPGDQPSFRRGARPVP